MKALHSILAGIILLSISAHGYSQINKTQDSTIYKVELFGSAATSSNTPFWMVSNRYGVVPLDAGNVFLDAGVFHNQHFGNKFRWGAGLDVIAAVPRHRNVFIQQAYAEIGYRSLLLSVGSKERYNSLWDRNLSSGDMVQSPNARPIPELNLSMPGVYRCPLDKGFAAGQRGFCHGQIVRYRLSGGFCQCKTNVCKECVMAS